MEKLQLNKRTIAQMDRMQMRNVKGGINIPVCLMSCPGVGSRAGKSKKCCSDRSACLPEVPAEIAR